MRICPNSSVLDCSLFKFRSCGSIITLAQHCKRRGRGGGGDSGKGHLSFAHTVFLS